MSQIKKYLIQIIIWIQSSRLVLIFDELLFWRYEIFARYKPSARQLLYEEVQVLDHFRSIFKGVSVARTFQNRVFAFVGPPGVGKSSVANQMARRASMLVVCANEVRVELRRRKLGYENVQEICNILTLELLKLGFSVVLDSDHIDPFKRARLRVFLARLKVRPQFIRVTCNNDVAVERILKKEYGPESLYDEAFAALNGVSGANFSSGTAETNFSAPRRYR